MIVAGVCSILWPRTMWYLGEGWKYKNVEPSDAALVIMRLGGVMGIIGAILFLIVVSNMFRGVPAGFP